MEKISLQATKRELTGKKVSRIREEGKIPVVLYGQGKDAENLTIDLGDFTKVFAKAGGNTLVDLKIDDQKPIKILVHDTQADPTTDTFIHADLYKIKMDEEITTEIPLKFFGESLAVKELEGNLIKNKTSVEVTCLPGNLIHDISVDISVLKTFDDSIHVKDLVVPENIKIEDDPEDTIALVNAPISEEELEAMEEESAADEEKEAVEKMEAEAEAEKAEAEESTEEKPESKKD